VAGKGHGRVLRVRVGVEAGGGVGAVAAERGGGGARGRLPGLALAHGRLPGQAASSVSDGCHIPQQHLQRLKSVPALQPGLRTGRCGAPEAARKRRGKQQESKTSTSSCVF
jgi:hypothetical protein